jgi:hypothetical protein
VPLHDLNNDSVIIVLLYSALFGACLRLARLDPLLVELDEGKRGVIDHDCPFTSTFKIFCLPLSTTLCRHAFRTEINARQASTLRQRRARIILV